MKKFTGFFFKKSSQSVSKQDLLTLIPDVLLLIFNQLDVISLERLRKVSKGLKQLLDKSDFNRTLWQKWLLELPTNPNTNLRTWFITYPKYRRQSVRYLGALEVQVCAIQVNAEIKAFRYATLSLAQYYIEQKIIPTKYFVNLQYLFEVEFLQQIVLALDLFSKNNMSHIKPITDLFFELIGTVETDKADPLACANSLIIYVRNKSIQGKIEIDNLVSFAKENSPSILHSLLLLMNCDYFSNELHKNYQVSLDNLINLKCPLEQSKTELENQILEEIICDGNYTNQLVQCINTFEANKFLGIISLPQILNLSREGLSYIITFLNNTEFCEEININLLWHRCQKDFESFPDYLYLLKLIFDAKKDTKQNLSDAANLVIESLCGKDCENQKSKLAHIRRTLSIPAFITLFKSIPHIITLNDCFLLLRKLSAESHEELLGFLFDEEKQFPSNLAVAKIFIEFLLNSEIPKGEREVFIIIKILIVYGMNRGKLQTFVPEKEILSYIQEHGAPTAHTYIFTLAVLLENQIVFETDFMDQLHKFLLSLNEIEIFLFQEAIVALNKSASIESVNLVMRIFENKWYSAPCAHFMKGIVKLIKSNLLFDQNMLPHFLVFLKEENFSVWATNFCDLFNGSNKSIFDYIPKEQLVPDFLLLINKFSYKQLYSLLKAFVFSLEQDFMVEHDSYYRNIINFALDNSSELTKQYNNVLCTVLKMNLQDIINVSEVADLLSHPLDDIMAFLEIIDNFANLIRDRLLPSCLLTNIFKREGIEGIKAAKTIIVKSEELVKQGKIVRHTIVNRLTKSTAQASNFLNEIENEKNKENSFGSRF